MKKKYSWKIFLIFFIFFLAGISIFFLFRHFKSKPQKDVEENPSTNEKSQKNNNSPAGENEHWKQNIDYQPIQPTFKESEYQGKLLPISSAGTEHKEETKENYQKVEASARRGKQYGRCSDCGVENKKVEDIIYIKCGKCNEKIEGDDKLRCEKCNNKKFHHDCSKNNMLPRGSAILTGSGDLEKQGIKAIIHACPGSIEKIKDENFQPTIQGIIRSVQNSILLAERNNYKSIAFCLIGSNLLDNIFSTQGTKKENKLKLAEIIIKSAIEQRKNLESVVFVDFGNSAFIKTFSSIGAGEKYFSQKMKGMRSISGNISITDYSSHKCEVIVNSLNTEGEFINSGSFSGFIANQTGSEKSKIQKEIKEHIAEFNKRLRK